MASSPRGYPTAYREAASSYRNMPRFQNGISSLPTVVTDAPKPARLLEATPDLAREFDGIRQRRVDNGIRASVPRVQPGTSGVPNIPASLLRQALKYGFRAGGRFVPGLNIALTMYDAYQFFAWLEAMTGSSSIGVSKGWFDETAPGTQFDPPPGDLVCGTPGVAGSYMSGNNLGCGGIAAKNPKPTGYASDQNGGFDPFINPVTGLIYFWKYQQANAVSATQETGTAYWSHVIPILDASAPIPLPKVWSKLVVGASPATFPPGVTYDAIPYKQRHPNSEVGHQVATRLAEKPQVVTETSTFGPRGPQPPRVSVKTEVRKPPGKGTQEKKAAIDFRSGTGLVGALFGFLTEFGDDIDSFYDALPEFLKNKVWLHKKGGGLFQKEVKMGIPQKAAWVAQAWLDMATKGTLTRTEQEEYLNRAIYNLVSNRITDALVGRTASAAAREFGRVTGRPVAITNTFGSRP